MSQQSFDQTLPGVGNIRKHRRFKVSANILVLPLDDRYNPFWATCDDISRRGVFIHASRQLPEMLPVLLKIVVRRNGPPLRIKARVVHNVDGQGFGCQFIELGPGASTTLRHLLRLAALQCLDDN
jgi:hypothetical protein